MQFPFVFGCPVLAIRRVYRVPCNFILPESFGKTLRRFLVLRFLQYTNLASSVRGFGD